MSGRVVGISVEWSAGTCAIAPRRVHFTPAVGAVGDRVVEVISVAPAELGVRESLNLGIDRPVTLIVTTTGGELYWALPASVADEVTALLRVDEM